MKKTILAITLLFSHVSFGLDALDGNSIICEDSNRILGFRFVGHGAIREFITIDNGEVILTEDFTTRDEWNEVNLIDDFKIEFHRSSPIGFYRLDRETLELEWYVRNELFYTHSCSLYTNTTEYHTNMESMRRREEETYKNRLENRKI